MLRLLFAFSAWLLGPQHPIQDPFQFHHKLLAAKRPARLFVLSPLLDDQRIHRLTEKHRPIVDPFIQTGNANQCVFPAVKVRRRAAPAILGRPFYKACFDGIHHHTRILRLLPLPVKKLVWCPQIYLRFQYGVPRFPRFPRFPPDFPDFQISDFRFRHRIHRAPANCHCCNRPFLALLWTAPVIGCTPQKNPKRTGKTEEA